MDRYATILNKILANRIKKYTKNYTQSSRVSSRNSRLVQYLKVNWSNYHIIRLKKKKNLIILAIDADKACDKILHPFMINSENKNRGETPQCNKAHLQKTYS